MKINEKKELRKELRDARKSVAFYDKSYHDSLEHFIETVHIQSVLREKGILTEEVERVLEQRLHELTKMRNMEKESIDFFCAEVIRIQEELKEA